MNATGAMESSESPGNDVLSTVAAAPTRPCEVLFQSLEDATAVFSRELICITQPCTATKKRACQIIHHLSTWNEILFQANVELREQPRSRVGWTLASIDCPFVLDNGTTSGQRFPTLLYLLLKKHRCVTALDIVIGRLRSYHAVLYNALRDNEHVESIKIRGPIESSGGFHTFFSVIPSLKNLKHFECTAIEELRQPRLEALGSLLWTTRTLESLHIPHLWMTWMDSRDILTAIAAYPFLKHLSLNCSVFARAPFQCCDTFALYLKDNRTLTTLRLKGECALHLCSTKVILRALCANRSILTLEMENVGVDEEAVELVSCMLEQNTVLRRCHISKSFQKLFISPDGYCDGWFRAITKSDTLEEVTLPLCIWRLEQWRLFFSVISSKRSIRSVIIGLHDRHEGDFHQISDTLCGTGAEAKVNFHPFCAFSCSGDNLAALGCKSVANIVASSIGDARAPRLERLLRKLTPLSHVTSLTLFMAPHPSNKDLSSAIADYVGATTTLKKLHVIIVKDALFTDDNRIRWMTITESLSKNRSISELRIQTERMEAEEMEALGHALRFSESIRRFCLWDSTGKLSAAFLNQLSRDIATNYSLVHVHFPKYTTQDAFAVWNTARRNYSLVARASKFQLGGELERLTARALERVCRHRALLEEFADVERVSVEEAAAALRAALRTFDDMHAFMRLAGVVGTSVACHARQDGCVQLDDLNEDCWRALRRYLMLDDVVAQAPFACGPP